MQSQSKWFVTRCAVDPVHGDRLLECREANRCEDAMVAFDAWRRRPAVLAGTERVTVTRELPRTVQAVRA